MVKQLAAFPTTLFFDGEGNQVREPMEGAPGDPGEAYRDAVNQCLAEMGKGMIGP